MRFNGSIAACIIGAVAVVAIPVPVTAQAPGDPLTPQFWLSTPIPGVVPHPDFKLQAGLRTYDFASPREAAAYLVDFIDDNNLAQQDITIVPWLLGWRGTRGDITGFPHWNTLPYLWCHPLDALPNIENVHNGSLVGFPTPWTSHGITELDGAREWVDEFIFHYKAFGGPAPARLSMDSELAFIPDGIDAYHLYKLCFNDPRWATEQLQGFPPGTTMASLPSPPVDPTLTPFTSYQINQDWFNWFKGIMAQIMDATTSRAVYDRFRLPTNFPNCICGDYNMSLRVDGLGDPFRLVRDANHPGFYWNGYAYSGFGQMQPRSFYNVPTFFYPELATCDATVKFWGQQVDACIDSFGGGHDDEMSLWVFAVGLTGQVTTTTTKEDARQYFAFGHSRRVRFYDIFNREFQTQHQMDQTHQARQEAHSSYLVSAQLGSSMFGYPIELSHAQVELLRYGLRDTLLFYSSQAAEQDIAIETTFNTTIRTLGCPRMEAIIEARANVTAVDLDVYAYNASTSQWDLVGASQETSNTGVTRIRVKNLSAINHVTPAGVARLRFDYHSQHATPLQVEIDLIQLIGVRL